VFLVFSNFTTGRMVGVGVWGELRCCQETEVFSSRKRCIFYELVQGCTCGSNMSTVDCCWYCHEQAPIFEPAYFDRWKCVGFLLLLLLLLLFL